MTDIDFSKSEAAIEGRYRRAGELQKFFEAQRDLLCCFYGPGKSWEKDYTCRCLDNFPGRNPNCPLREEHERTDK